MAENISKIRKKLSSKNTITFLLFLLLSGVLWFTKALDNKRVSTLSVPIAYRGLPNDIKLVGDVPREVILKVKDEGIVLLKYHRKKKQPITVDLSQIKRDQGEIHIPNEQLKNRLSNYLQPTTTMLQMRPDSILLTYSKQASATLPIRLDTSIVLASQYLYAEDISIHPQTVTVYGAKSVIDTMKYVSTQKITLNQLKDTTRLKVKLIPPIEGVKYEQNKVDVTIYVEMFTERKVTLPITLINNEKNTKVRMFPSMATIVYNVGLSNYKRIRNNDLKPVFDLQKAKLSGNGQYKLEVINNSPYIKNITLIPPQVEFLIEE